MADIKFTGLPAGSSPFANTSVFAMSEDDGGFDSVKVTLTQVRAMVYDMEVEQSMTFDSSGTNKFFMNNAAGNGAGISLDSTIDYVGLEGDGTAQGFTKGYCYVDDSLFEAGYNESVGGKFLTDDVALDLSFGSDIRFQCNGTGIGFFSATPAAQPTGVAVSAAGIHAALVTLGLITA